MTGRDVLLAALLGCKNEDLAPLDKVRYDKFVWKQILERYDVKWRSINELMREVLKFGFTEIEIAVNDRICELEAITYERELDKDEETELSALRGLSPLADLKASLEPLGEDFVVPRASCVQHGDTYNAYLRHALDGFRDNTGVRIDGIDDNEPAPEIRTIRVELAGMPACELLIPIPGNRHARDAVKYVEDFLDKAFGGQLLGWEFVDGIS